MLEKNSIQSRHSGLGDRNAAEISALASAKSQTEQTGTQDALLLKDGRWEQIHPDFI